MSNETPQPTTWTFGLGLPPTKPAKARKEWREDWRERFRHFCVVASGSKSRPLTRREKDALRDWLGDQLASLGRKPLRLTGAGQEWVLLAEGTYTEVPRACYWPALEALVQRYPDAAKEASKV